MPADQRPVIVVKEEHPLQVRLRRRSRVPAVRRRLIIRQESTGIDRKVGPDHQRTLAVFHRRSPVKQSRRPPASRASAFHGSFQTAAQMKRAYETIAG